MSTLLRWLLRHPLVWLIPVLFFGLLLGYMAVKLSDSPQTEFIYDV